MIMLQILTYAAMLILTVLAGKIGHSIIQN